MAQGLLKLQCNTEDCSVEVKDRLANCSSISYSQIIVLLSNWQYTFYILSLVLAWFLLFFNILSYYQGKLQTSLCSQE